ncbi:cupin domain-containing protein, partial [Methylocapsa palsarum]
MNKAFMKTRVSSVLFSSCLLIAVQAVKADDAAIVKFPQDISFKDTAAGVQVAVLCGDPSQPGLYVVRLKLAAGTKVAAHTHPEEARTLTVLSGTLYFGFGDQFDDSKLMPYPAGTFFSEVPNVPHFVAAKD